jgi:hypothetical protein
MGLVCGGRCGVSGRVVPASWLVRGAGGAAPCGAARRGVRRAPAAPRVMETRAPLCLLLCRNSKAAPHVSQEPQTHGTNPLAADRVPQSVHWQESVSRTDPAQEATVGTARTPHRKSPVGL